MKLSEVLQESITDIVYHATNAQKANSIVKSNKFILTPSQGISSENEYSNKLFFLSTTRSRSSGDYHKDSKTSVLFVLDGRALSYNFSGKPINYWAGGFHRSDTDEAEDRIFSNKPEINNADRYIKSVDILYNESDERVHRQLYKLYYECKRHHIPVRLYDNNYDWRLGTNNYIRDIEKIKQLNVKPSQDDLDFRKSMNDLDIKRELGKKEYDRVATPENAFAILNDFLETGKLNRHTSIILRKYGGFSGASVLKSDMHNASRAQGTKKNDNLNKLIMTMNRNGLRTSKQVSDYLQSYIRKHRII